MNNNATPISVSNRDGDLEISCRVFKHGEWPKPPLNCSIDLDSGMSSSHFVICEQRMRMGHQV